MKKFKDFMYTLAAEISGAALIIMVIGLTISGAIWAIKILLSLIGVI